MNKRNYNPAAAFYQQQGAAAAYKQMLGTLDEFELRLKSMLDEGNTLRLAETMRPKLGEKKEEGKCK